MPKILSITLGGKEVPSSNFRFRCYYSYLQKSGFSVKEVNTRSIFKPSLPKIPKIHAIVNILGLKKYFINKNLDFFEKEVQSSDIIWVNKALSPELYDIVKKYNKPVVFDIDDAIWLGGEEFTKENLSVAHTVVVGNNYLAEEIAKICSAKIKIIPTTIELEQYPEKSHKEKKERIFRIGWLGSSYTNDYIAEISSVLNQFLNENDSELYIISSKMEKLKAIFPQKTIFKEWQENTYIEEISNFDVGIMPMPDNEWVKGKCSFKMLQYMGAFVPVVVSPYGMNADVLAQGKCGFSATNLDDWKNSFNYLYTNKKEAISMGENGRKIIEEKYSTKTNFQLLLEVFQKINT